MIVQPHFLVPLLSVIGLTELLIRHYLLLDFTFLSHLQLDVVLHFLLVDQNIGIFT